jgi:endo-1,4-beta-D-glucanase Y
MTTVKRKEYKLTYNQRMRIKEDIARNVAIGDIFIQLKRGKTMEQTIYLQVVSKQVTRVEVRQVESTIKDDMLVPIINNFVNDEVIVLNIAYLIDNKVYLTKRNYKAAVSWEHNREFYKSQMIY